jgi:HEAT repeat protein
MRVITLMLILGICVAAVSNVQAQDMNALISQLAGKTEAPQRTEVQLAEAYEKAIGHLIPLMGADDVASRYNYQIALQDMGAHAARPGAETQRRALAEVMVKTLEQAEMSKTVRYWLVLQLERIGKEESVATLAEFMASDDTNLRDCARRALQANPALSATTALVKAFDEATDPTLKISLASTLGARRAQTAVASLAKAINARDQGRGGGDNSIVTDQWPE